MRVSSSRKWIRLLTYSTVIIGLALHIWHVFMHWEILTATSKAELLLAQQKSNNLMAHKGEQLAKPKMLMNSRTMLRPDFLLSHRFYYNVCEKAVDVNIDLLIIIMSHHSEFSLRNKIRQTWASASRNNGTSNARHVFIVANDSTDRVSAEIDSESRLFKDVVMLYDVIDSYENLTVKTILGLKYAASYCNRARYVMKTDSDVYVNMSLLLRYLHPSRTPELNAFGLLRVNATPVRYRNGPNGKWFVPFREFSKSQYPNYLDGMGYLLSLKVVTALVEVFPFVRFFRFEDVYIGMCLDRLGIQPKGIRGFLRPNVIPDPCSPEIQQLIAIHGMNEALLQAVWTVNCTGIRIPSTRTSDKRNRWIKHKLTP